MQVLRYNLDQKLFSYNLSKHGLRVDGRQPLQYRTIEIDVGVIEKCLGSAKVIIGKTEVIASVKAKLSKPSLDAPNKGLFKISLFCSPTVRKITRRIGEQRFREIRTKLREAYGHLPLQQFCIVAGKKCWKIKVKIILLSYGGTFYDPISIAIKTALMTSTFPKINHVSCNGDVVQVKISRKIKDSWKPDVTDVPCIITLRKVGDMTVIDTLFEEEESSLFSYVIPVTESGRLLSGFKVGTGHTSIDTLSFIITEGKKVGMMLHSHINDYVSKRLAIEQMSSADS